MEKEQLKEELKAQVIEFLNLAPMTAAEIKDDMPFFGEGLGLDSIDSLELVVMLKRQYGIDIQDPKEGRKILVDINTMADYVEKNRTIPEH
ncbi:acyl carrier protein [Sphingobacteriaceae bacterium]|nr:acyl carrier protein [Sphingobacteriaceae bacterium]